MTPVSRIALVTGANKGIGLEIAQQLAQAGIFVLIGARDSRRGDIAVSQLSSRGVTARNMKIDLNDHASIVSAAEIIRDDYGRLDILVNNAVIGDPEDGPPTGFSIEAARRNIETNFIGTLAVTQAMLPLLRNAPAARAVNLSSPLGSLSLNGDPSSPYYSTQYVGHCASKTAVNMLTVQLAAELRETAIVVNSVCPGFVKTDLNGNTGILTPEEGAEWPVKYALLGSAAVSGRFVEAGVEIAW